MQIEKAAILGAGTMGSAIAAHIANAGTDVILLDIVPEDAGNRRNKLAEEALEKMKGKGRAFAHPDNVRHISCGNFEDDMERLQQCDWIIEAVIEDRDIKKDLFQRVDHFRKEESIVSSNTSTLPLKLLKQEQSPELRNDLYITHFFNPPRQMRLLEFISDTAIKNDDKIKALKEFADKKLGKTIIEAHDTPGFIGNRLGVFWMLTGLQQALTQNVPVPMADKIMGRQLGFPKTGIFGLLDLVGVALMRDLAHSLCNQLPDDSALQGLEQAVKFLDEMEAERFYKKDKDKMLAWDLQKGGYAEPPAFAVDEKLDLQAALVEGSEDAAYAKAVLLRTLNYACTCLPEIADSVADADTAMRLGFNWERGPFEMIDALGNDDPGTAVLIEALEAQDLIPAPFLQKARTGPFYKQQNDQLFYLLSRDGYTPKRVSRDKWMLADKVRGDAPVLENEAAKLWDIGDGIACFEFTTKMGTLNPDTFDLLEKAVEKIKTGFVGLIIGHDHKHFSAGLDLHMLLELCEEQNWDQISALVRRGQQMMMALKYAPFPVVGAPAGKALGGGCEMLLHCDGIQACVESYIGLVEPRIGLVPAWGGCKEMLAHHLRHVTDNGPARQACEKIFADISHARTSGSAQMAPDQLFFKTHFRTTMNRARVLAEAKVLCLSLVHDYEAPAKEKISIPAGVKKLYEKQIKAHEDIDRYDKEVLQHLAHVLSGGDDGGKDYTEDEILNLEHEAFMTLIRNAQTQDKITEVL